MTTGFAIDHVQIAMPVGGEAQARRYFGALLGLPELSKPDDMAARGGCWFQLGGQQLHLGAEAVFVPANKAHVAIATTNLGAVRATLMAAGYVTHDDNAINDRRRFFSHDPFGNRIEFIDMTAT